MQFPGLACGSQHPLPSGRSQRIVNKTFIVRSENLAHPLSVNQKLRCINTIAYMLRGVACSDLGNQHNNGRRRIIFRNDKQLKVCRITEAILHKCWVYFSMEISNFFYNVQTIVAHETLPFCTSMHLSHLRGQTCQRHQ